MSIGALLAIEVLLDEAWDKSERLYGLDLVSAVRDKLDDVIALLDPQSERLNLED